MDNNVTHHDQYYYFMLEAIRTVYVVYMYRLLPDPVHGST